MDKTENSGGTHEGKVLPTCNQHEEFVVQGRLVTTRPKHAEPSSEVSPERRHPTPPEAQVPSRHMKVMGFPVTKNRKAPQRRSDLLQAPEILTLDELARRAIEGVDYATVMDELTDLGPDARLLLYYLNGKLVRQEVFEDPRICKDIQRGGVIHNFEQKPADVSGWRVHEFYIDSKGCLGEICSRCLRVCPESAIHMRGEGATSFCEIDQSACKGCYICWVECARKAADCILVDGKVFDSELRAHHFGE